jgi:hypothetical protein
VYEVLGYLWSVAREARRPNRASVCLYGLAAFAFACAPRHLPNDQILTSAHFRYHARADAVLDPTIMDRLEAHRTEFDARFGVAPGMIDYYLFRDHADQRANSPCPEGTSCTDERSVMTSAPFHEHELVHAFLYDTGEPAPVVAEGFAQYESCLFPRFAYLVPPDQWPVAVGPSATGPFTASSASVYNFGQRLVAWMLAAGGTERLLDFYHRCLPTIDAALFALQFERYWGRRIADVAVEIQDARFAGSSCPCAAPPLPADGSPTPFVALQDYRTVDVAQESRLELGSSGPLIYPASCVNAVDSLAYVIPAASVANTVARVGAGRFGVLAWPGADGATVTVRGTQQPQSDWSCAAAMKAPVVVGAGDVALWVTPDMASDPNGTWFAVNIDGPRVLSMLSDQGLATACIACDRCFGAALPPPFVTPGGIVVVHLMNGFPDSDHTSIGVLLSHPTP